jgi:hypothetical protein
MHRENSDLAGMLMAPLALLALVFERKKTRTKFDLIIRLFGYHISHYPCRNDGGMYRDRMEVSARFIGIGNRRHCVLYPIAWVNDRVNNLARKMKA